MYLQSHLVFFFPWQCDAARHCGGDGGLQSDCIEGLTIRCQVLQGDLQAASKVGAAANFKPFFSRIELCETLRSSQYLLNAIASGRVRCHGNRIQTGFPVWYFAGDCQ